MPAALQYVDDDDWNSVRTNADTTAFLLNPPVPQARVYNNAPQTIGTGSATALTFDSERYDSGDLHSTSSNTGRLTAPITGLYSVGACIEWAANVTGVREILLRRNGSTFIVADLRPTSASAIQQSVHTDYQLAAGDYVEVVVVQNSGGNLNVQVAANYSPEFWMHRIAGYVNQGV